MRIPDGFLGVVREGWRVWVAPGWESQIDAILQEGRRPEGWLHRSKHARTRRLDLTGSSPAYLKAYHSYRLTGLLKDAVRPAKALRALVMSDELERAGLAATRVVAAGELRYGVLLRSAFLVTLEVDAPDAIEFIGGSATDGPVVEKRHFLRMLGKHVARMHDAGFCHGDLVPTNVRVQVGSTGPRIVLLDNDRTTLGRRAVPLWRARRNLVQLNRFVVGGLTAVDRWRVFRAYCESRHLDRRTSRRLARWVIRKTIERRRRFDGIEDAAQIGFRALMHTSGPQLPQGS